MIDHFEQCITHALSQPTLPLNPSRVVVGHRSYASLFNQIPAQRHLRKALVPWHYEPPYSFNVAGNNQPVPIPVFSQSFFLGTRVPDEESQ